MKQKDTLIRIGSDCRVFIVDPKPAEITFIQHIDPGFEIRMRSLPGFTSPGFMLTRNMGCGVSDLSGLSEYVLWGIYEDAMADPPTRILPVAGASLLDLKI